MKKFGNAVEFYRIRLQKISDDVGLDMDWDDKILYRRPPPFKAKTITYYTVQAVTIVDNKVFNLKKFMNKREAERFQKNIVEELADLTKKQFDEKFIN